jgi:hypothetical protein
MNMQSRHELTVSLLPRYLRADKKEKGRMLDEYCANTGYARKYAIAKLKKYQFTDNLSRKAPGAHAKRRKKTYGNEVKAALVPLWEASDRLSSKLFHPYLPELLRVMKAHKEIVVPKEIEEKLLAMSHGTCATLLDEIRIYKTKKLHGTTKPGTLLKSMIPLRFYTNFFKPAMKCVEKKRIGSGVVKKYDRPRTPY